MAEIPTFQEMPSIDTDGDGTASAAELAAWADGDGPDVRPQPDADGRRRAGVARGSLGRPCASPRRPGRVADPAVRRGVRRSRSIATGRIVYRDENDADKIGWREITAVGEDGEAISGSDVPAQSVSDALLSYPQDLLSSPLHVTSMHASFAPGVSIGPARSTASEATDAARPGVDTSPFASLVDNHGIVLVLLGVRARGGVRRLARPASRATGRR